MKIPNWTATVIVGMICLNFFASTSRSRNAKIIDNIIFHTERGQLAVLTASFLVHKDTKMTGKIQQVSLRGGCAHGLPAGACPICSGGGSGGGGGSSIKKSNQMSWAECYSIGQAMKAAKERAMDNKVLDLNAQARTAAMNRQDTVVLQNSTLSNVINVTPNNAKTPIETIKQKVNEFLNKVAENISKFAAAVNDKLAMMKEKMQNIANTLSNIMDKLAAYIGEQENRVKEYLGKNLKKLKKKLFGFFESIDASMEQGSDEDYKEIEELLKEEYKDYE